VTLEGILGNTLPLLDVLGIDSLILSLAHFCRQAVSPLPNVLEALVIPAAIPSVVQLVTSVLASC